MSAAQSAAKVHQTHHHATVNLSLTQSIQLSIACLTSLNQPRQITTHLLHSWAEQFPEGRHNPRLFARPTRTIKQRVRKVGLRLHDPITNVSARVRLMTGLVRVGKARE